MTTARTLSFFIAGLLIFLPSVQGREIEALALRPSIDRRSEPLNVAVSPPARTHLARVMNQVTVPTGSELWSILRSDVHSATEERSFFAHQAFTGLSVAERQEFFELLAQSSPRKLLRLRHSLVPTMDARHPRAAAGKLETELISTVSAMTPQEQLSTFLGRQSRMAGKSKKTRKLLSIEERVKRLASDPAIARNFRVIDDAWLAGLAAENIADGVLYVSPSELIQAKIMIARNLYFQEAPATRESVRSEYSRILRLRQHYRGLPLFSSRHVVYASSDDRVESSGSYAFGRLPTRRYIEKQGAALTFLRDGETPLGAGAQRQRLATLLEDSPSLTFLFEGHGRGDALKLTGKLTADAFAATIAARADSRANRDVAIALFVTCSGHDFSRSVLSRLDDMDPDIPKPIMITPGEFGQAWIKSVYSDPFLIQGLGLGGSTATTLGSLFDTRMIGTSVYVPDENNVPVQIL